MSTSRSSSTTTTQDKNGVTVVRLESESTIITPREMWEMFKARPFWWSWWIVAGFTITIELILLFR